MPRTRHPFAADEIVRPLQPFSGDHDGQPIVLNPVHRLRGDDPLVRRWPQMFIAEAATTRDVVEARADVVAAALPPPRPRPAQTPPIPPTEAAVAGESFHVGDRYVAKG